MFELIYEKRHIKLMFLRNIEEMEKYDKNKYNGKLFDLFFKLNSRKKENLKKKDIIKVFQ
jgi:hypothetical protein